MNSNLLLPIVNEKIHRQKIEKQPIFSSGLKRYSVFCLLSSLLILLSFPTSLSAQTLGNEWINFSQQYYKIPVSQTGIYRIMQSDLVAAGFPVAAVDPRRIQLFHRGEEQAIFINGEADANFQANDYIEFYGQRNDGTLDAELYRPSSAQPHKFYNLYSDTTAYFLTWRLDNGFGKRMTTFSEGNTSNIPAETYHWEDNLLVLTNEYATGQKYERESENSQAEMSYYDFGEGFVGPETNKYGSALKDTLKSIKNTINDPLLKSKLDILVVGISNVSHNVEISAGPNADPMGKVQFQYCNSKLFSTEVKVSDMVRNGVVAVSVKSLGTSASESARIAVSYVRLRYPQSFDMAGSIQKFYYLASKASDKSYIEIPSPAANTILYDVTIPNAIRKIATTITNGKLSAIVSGTSTPRTILANSSFLPSPKLAKVGFRNIDPTKHNYIILSNKLLMKSAGGYDDVVKAYAGYRASQEGGKYDTLVIDVEMLFDQFSYGEFTPLAIRKFASFMLKTGKPQFMFIIGRSLSQLADFRDRTIPKIRRQPDRRQIDLVPTIGYPGSDLALTMGLTANTFVPAIPTGRINATTPVHVLNYFNKVKEHEATPANALWRKNLLHLSGGKTQAQLNLFKRYIDDFKDVAEGLYLGGKVASLSKKTDNNVELINVSEQVNNGVSLITFFGHSARNITDIEIGFVSDDLQGYRNKGKYPMLFINGCEAGDIYKNLATVGEDWILTPDRGAILCIAHSAIGYSSPLKRYTDAFYYTTFADSSFLGKPMGVIQQETIRKFIFGYTDYLSYMSHVEQMTLQGDPAVVLLPLEKPDYYTADDQLFLKSFDNTPITAVTDSFQIGIITSNFSRISQKPIPVSVRRILGDGTVQAFDTISFNPVYYKDTLYYTIRTNGLQVGGNQRFEVQLDVTHSIDELNENNNSGSLEYVMPSVGAIPLFPREYSIVNSQPVKFVAQATSFSSENRSYLFELDTLSTFSSAAKMSTTVTAGYLPSWTTSLLSSSEAHDSTVYYWRIRYADLPEGSANAWVQSSFIYINKSPEGWSQSRFPQFSKANLSTIARNSTIDKWEFTETSTQITIDTLASNTDPSKNKVRLLINGAAIVTGGICGNSLTAVAFNKSTMQPYSVLPARNCGKEPYVANALPDDLTNGFLGTYLNGVTPGDYVLLFTTGNIAFPNWPPEVKKILEQIGANPDNVNKLQYNDPYIILGKKGDAPGSAIEVLADYSSSTPSNRQFVFLKHTLKGRNNKGVITSSIVGPASLWGTAYNKILPEVESLGDKWQLDLIGVNFKGVEKVVYADVKTSPLPIDFIDAKTYPYLKLRLLAKDTVNLTPPQLKKWQVIYEGVPEGLLNPEFAGANAYKIPDQTEGQQFTLNFVFQNISPRDFKDSLVVQYTNLNLDSRKQTLQSFKVKPLVAGDTVKFSVTMKTSGLGGNNQLQVFVNPRIQAEQNYANNIADIPFKVKHDNENPILDVTFDGVRIMDGDIVSPSPLIAVSLKDENKVLIRKDTVGMELYLKKPCEGCTFVPVSLADGNVRWTPAGTDNDFRLEYQPKNLSDGTYTLQVKGKDISGNASGTEPYRISFEVVNASSVTHFYPYPNPFSTKTRFVFTLTGSEVPDQIKVQVMTVTGKVIREITQDELGPVHIGNNISAYAWDGTDEFGDKLANGVYLYRVITKINGQTIEHRQTSADKAFTKNFGKLYILR
jgi:hypothetical protein